MAAERLPVLKEWQENRAQKPYVLSIPGASTTNDAAIAMNSVWGPSIRDALVPNSIVNQEFKKEPPDKDRYKKLFSVAKTQIESGRNLNIDTGSLGSAELCFFMDEMVGQMGQDWLQQHKDQFHLVLTSPSAPKNKRESVKYLGKYLGPVALQEAGAIPFVLPVPRKTRFLRSVQQFVSIPPEDFAEHAATYTEGLRKAGRKLSQASKITNEIREIPFEPDPQRNYLTVFSEEKQQQIRELDRRLLALMQQEGNEKVVRRLLKSRAKLTQPEFNNIYSGKYAEAMGDQPRGIPQVEPTKEGKQLRREVLRDTFWKTNIFDRLSTIADTGIQMTVVVPEFDVLFSVERAEELAGGRDNVSVVLARSRTHGFPPGSHPEIALPLFELPKAEASRGEEIASRKEHALKGHGVFVAGGLGRYAGLRPVLAGLEEVYGAGNATVYSSALFGDIPASDKFAQMGAHFKNKIQEGPVHFIAHSYGVPELCAAFDAIEKDQAGFLSQLTNTQNMKITLISPTGLFENRRQGIGYMARFAKVGVNEGGILGVTVPGKTSLLRGIASVGILPPENIDHETLVENGRAISSKLSQAQEGLSEIDIVSRRNYIEVFDAAKQTKVREADGKLAEAIENGVPRDIRRAWKRRGRKAGLLMRNVLDGKYADRFADPTFSEQKQRRTRAGVSSQVRLLKETFFQGKVLKRLQQLKDAGVEIEILVPEQDIMVTVKEAERLGVPIRVIPLTTHSSPWGAQKDAIKQIAEAA